MSHANALTATALISFLVFVASPVAAETMTFKASLDGAQETPPTTRVALVSLI